MCVLGEISDQFPFSKFNVFPKSVLVMFASNTSNDLCTAPGLADPGVPLKQIVYLRAWLPVIVRKRHAKKETTQLKVRGLNITCLFVV